MIKNIFSNRGETTYDKSILNEIVSIALKESEDVGEIYLNAKQKKAKNKNSNERLKIEIDNKVVSVSVDISVKNGCSVPEVASIIQENIKCRVETMTDYKIKDVNINIVDAEF